MKKINLVMAVALAASMVGFGTAASAAEAGKPWDGWSTGVYLGNANGKSKLSTSAGFSNYFSPSLDDGPQAIEDAGNGSRSTNHFLGGLSLGYGKQFGSVFVGGELDYTNFNRDVSQTASAVYPCCAASGNGFTNKVSVSSDWIMSARTRVGYANASSLTYFTAGLAATDLTVKHEWNDSFGGRAQSARSNMKLGWTAGVGYEHMLGNNWSVKGEYLYANFGSVASHPGQLMLLNTSFGELQGRGDMTVQMLRVGLNKRW